MYKILLFVLMYFTISGRINKKTVKDGCHRNWEHGARERLTSILKPL